MGVTVYVREKGGKQRFIKATPETPADSQFWFSVCENGKQRWVRVKKDVSLEKGVLEREMERNAVARKYGLPNPVPGRLTVKEAIHIYIENRITAGKRPGTIGCYKFALGLFEKFCKTVQRVYVDEITGTDLLAFKAYLRQYKSDRGKRYRRRSINNRFVDVQIFLKFNGKSRLVPSRDMPKFRERPVTFYTETEITKFYSAATTHKERLLLDLLCNTGFRIGEVAHLTYADVDFEGNKITVNPKEVSVDPDDDWEAKTDEPVVVRVPQPVMDNLRAWRDAHPDYKWVFPSQVGTADEHLLKFIKRLAARAGIGGRVDCHKFRSTFATRMSGIFKLQDVQKMLGHKKIQTTLRYAGATNIDSPEYIAKIEGGKAKAAGA